MNRTLWLLIKTAYGVHDSQIIDGPSWIDTDHWDINVTATSPSRRLSR